MPEATWLELPSDLPWAPTATLGRLTLDDGSLGHEPTELEPFEVRQELGRGGMGVVHVAWQTRLGREVAVKRALSEGAERQLHREAWLTGRLQHPNIVPVHDLVRDEAEGSFLVMRRIQGTAWSELLDGRSPLPDHARHDPQGWHLGVLAQVCQAVAHAHAQGVLHRDLKPDNVMVGAFGEVYVVDWGLAVRLDRLPDGRLVDLAGQVGLCGTPAFMPPEMFRVDAGAVGEGTDVYLLGAMLWAIGIGEPMRRGTDLASLRDAAQQTPRVPQGTSASLADLLRRSLAVDPGARPTVRGFHDALVRYTATRDVEARVAGARERVAAVVARVATDDPSPRADYGAARALLAEVRSRLPDHHEAERLWQQLAGAMAEAELARGNPAAARLVLAEAPELLAAYAARLEEAEAELAQAGERLAELEADASHATSAAPRTALIALLGLVWVSIPLGLGTMGLPRGIPWVLVHSAFTAAVLAVGGLAFRRSLASSRLNRGAYLLLWVSVLGGLLLAAVAWRLDLSAEALTTVRSLHDASLILVCAVLLDARVLPGALAMLGAALATAVAPAWASWFLVPATGVLVGTLLVMWGPVALRGAGVGGR